MALRKAAAVFICTAAMFVATAHGANWGAAAIAMDAARKADEERQEFEYRRRMQELELERIRQQNELQRQRIANERAQAEAQSRRNAESSQDAVKAVQEAIDRIPKLKQWQETNDPKWTRAKEVDAILRNMPENESLPLHVRFAKVVKFVEVESEATK